MRRQGARVGLLLAALALPGGTRAQVTVPLDSSPLEGAIVGRVCVDADADGRCAPHEEGQAGVRLLLSNGQSVVTDARGRYALAALPSRLPLPGEGGRFLRGRYRLKVDVRSLPASLRPVPEGASVEVPQAGMALQDFALRPRVQRTPTPLSVDYGSRPPEVSLREGGLAFEVAGRTAPGDGVAVEGRAVEVDAEGRYRASVGLAPGPNTVALTVTDAEGRVRLFTQQVDVVEREGSLLVVPRAPQLAATVQLPGTRESVPTGTQTLSLQAPAGTRLEGPWGTQTVGPSGTVAASLVLQPGPQQVPLRLVLPDGTERREVLQLQAVPAAVGVGLLDVEAAWDVQARRLRLEGQGSAHAELPLGAWSLAGELALTDADVRAVRQEGAGVLLTPRRPERFARALDPEAVPSVLGADSTTATPNAAEGRLRLEARHPEVGQLGFGTWRLQLDGTEVGRYHRPLFGPYADVRARVSESLSLSAEAGADVGLADPTRALATRAAHEEFRATGGSLFYLRHPFVSEGSERLRVELRDGVTGLVLAERHLVRGRDYELDARAGRILLARPLSFVQGLPFLPGEALTAAPEPVLLVDYAHLTAGEGARQAVGGEVEARVLGATVGVGGATEGGAGGDFRLLRAHASLPVGALRLLLEAARSWGSPWQQDAFLRSDDGGLYARAVDPALLTGGDALTARLKGPLLGEGSLLDASWRVRTAGFSDGAHADGRRFRQGALRLRQPVAGGLVLSALADTREGVASGGRHADQPYGARSLGAGVAWGQSGHGLSLDGRDESLRVEGQEGGRTALGLAGHYRVHERLTLRAAHRQVLARRGEGPGATDDSFSSLGADVLLEEGMRLGVHGGWGPVLGPLAWLQGEVRRGADTWYGAYSVDVDGPDVGTARSVSGARTEVGDGSSVYVEEVAAHDTEAVRASRAVGLSQTLPSGWNVFARYERGVRDPLGLPSPLSRDAGAVGASLVSQRLRVQGRLELRREGDARAAATPATLQRLLSLAAELQAREDVTLGVRANASDSERAGLTLARFVESSVGVAWRPGPWALVGRYAFTLELPPPARGRFGERELHVLSLMPALQLGERLAVSAGAHGALVREAGSAWLVLSGALRPSVRVWGDVEAALEVAGRTAAPDGGELLALRGEVGLRLEERTRLALGYTVFGFSGLGLTREEERGDRVYLRAELAW